MLAAGPAAEVLIGDEDAGVGESGGGEGMRFALGGEALDGIGKGVLADAVEGDSFQKPRRDDAVRVNVVAAQRNAGAGDGGNCFACHVNSPNVPAHQ